MIDAKKLGIALFFLLLASAASAEALLVTISFDNGSFQIKHAELMEGDGQNYSEAGTHALVYETPTNLVVATWFYMPLISFTKEGTEVQDHAEQTLAIPFERGAQTLSVYDENGNNLASLDLTGLSSVGDSIGSPPTESLAASTGTNSVALAVNDSLTRHGTASGEGAASNEPSTQGAGSADSSSLGDEIIGLITIGVIGAIFLGIAGAVYFFVLKGKKPEQKKR